MALEFVLVVTATGTIPSAIFEAGTKAQRNGRRLSLTCILEQSESFSDTDFTVADAMP
ncbi:MAG TPA: hypothetical protein VGH79_09200 [Gaiellaceae bacterium]